MSELGDDHLRRFESMIDNRVLTRFDPAGQMDGTLFKSVESSLTKLADTYRGTNDAQLVEPLRHLREIVRDQLASSQTDPALSGYLRNTNYAYAMMQRVRDAATRRAGSEAKFTPTDLLTAVRGGDPSTNHAVFGHGDELFQTFAEAANRLMVGRSREMPHVTLTNTATGAALRPAYGAFDAAQRRPMIGGSIMGGAGAAGSVAGEESSPNPRTLRPSVGGP
jgi:hypothetical protein